MKALMKLQSIFKRITGFSSPLFGLSWNVKESEEQQARRIISFLEDKRILYVPIEWDKRNPKKSVRSVLNVRDFITKEIGKQESSDFLVDALREIRLACRDFLIIIDTYKPKILVASHPSAHSGAFKFEKALLLLRAAISVQIFNICDKYGIQHSGELESMVDFLKNPEEIEKRQSFVDKERIRWDLNDLYNKANSADHYSR